MKKADTRKLNKSFKPEFKITPEVKSIFLDWCLWNVRRLSQIYWDYKYPLLSQAEFKGFWWRKGLQDYWMEFHSGLKLMAEAEVSK